MTRVLFLAAFMMLCTAAPAHALLCNVLTGCSCSVSATPVQFGGISPMAGAASAQGNVNVNCTGVIDVAPSVSVKLNRGLYGAITARQMHSGADALDYNLYTTSLHALIWGDGSAGNSAINLSGGLLSLGHWSANHDVYGQTVPTIASKPGVYSDTIVVRIDW